MAFIRADRVKDTTTTTGTGAVTVSGTAPTGFRTFSAVCSTNDTIPYCIAGGAEWEVGIGTYSATNEITRTTILASSNGGSAVNFSAGTKDVFITKPAAYDILQAGNIGVAASVSSNALTVSLKGANGSDPSVTNPVFLTFRNATATSGASDTIAVTSATSITLSSGSSLGVVGTASLWLVAFNDSGTVRLGLVNCLSGGSVMPLAQHAIGSSTAEGGAGGADSAQVIYTGTAVTSKPYIVIARLAWETAISTPGLWAVGHDRIDIVTPNSKMPGDVVQVSVGALTSSFTTTSTTYTDLTGVSTSITPTSSANIMLVSASIQVSGTANTNGVQLKSVRGSTDIIIGDAASSRGRASAHVTAMPTGFINSILPAAWAGYDKPATTSATTYKVQLRCNAAGTAYINRSELDADASAYSRTTSSITVSEIMC